MTRAGTILLLASLAPCAGAGEFTYADAQVILKRYCQTCHQGAAPAGGLAVAQLTAPSPLNTAPWAKLLLRVRNGEMPPKGVPAPPPEEREAWVAWMEQALHTAACANGLAPGPHLMRRLNRDEYAATIRDLLRVHFNAGHALPADGAGGEGFDNAAETLFLSPIHAEKYLEAAKEALDYGSKDPKARTAFLIAEPREGTSPEQAARQVLEAFLPRAFRRPAKAGELERYLNLFRGAQKRGENFDRSILFALAGVLVSPNFLFHVEEASAGSNAEPEPKAAPEPKPAPEPIPAPEPKSASEPNPGPRPVGSYALASRLSYFLWGTMPDSVLFDLAAQGRLQDPAVLTAQIGRMLKDERARDFAERFIDQWLNIRELGRDIKPDEKLFPAYYDAELQSAIRYEPILFFQELLSQDLPLLNLLDANFTILTNRLARHYNLSVKDVNQKDLSQQPKQANLPPDSHRGGILTMAAVLAVSSYPQRTSPVLRGKWILETMLGTPPPPPPANVPALKEDHDGAAAQTLRERLEEHRRDPVCASCHNRIDPLGFALENYDVLGRWRTEDNGKPIDNRGELPDGTRIDGPEKLKKVLLDRKQVFLRHLTSRMLGYALGRGLTPSDSCTVDQILDQLEKEQYRGQALIRGIVLSVPFRYQSGGAARF
ncbi:MAG TPA: DUF1592 domain-containing protein [Candidatus Acidoferrales bacterium]|nr:DUF1592 domain-containing protein [Candidatus Acidoferrales bacterium]